MKHDTYGDGVSPPPAMPRLHRKRGRPKNISQSHDCGTPELVMKRLRGETKETLDLCLERGIITSEQHWCGIHLRWLYTVRYGAPGIRAVDTTHLGGMETRLNDPEWMIARETEYQKAMALLAQTGHALKIVNMCVYNERPGFLDKPAAMTKQCAHDTQAAIDHLVTGLDILVEHWGR